MPDVEPFFRNILDQNNLLYGYWDTQHTEFPTAQTLQQFPIVVLSCSWQGGLSSEQERNALRTYLDGGGNLFICGQDIGYILSKRVETPETRAFMHDYLHAEYLADDSEDEEVQGVAGDPISSEMSFHIWQPGPRAVNQMPDVIAPTAGSSAIFTYRDDRTGAVKFAGGHKVVYLGFGLEAVDSYENTKIGDPSPVRTELFLRILNWLNYIEHEPLTLTENVTSARTVSARITGNASRLESVTLFWRLQGETNFTAVPMIETSAQHYAAQIPGPGVPATIEYYIQTIHPYYNWQSPVGAPDTVHSYYSGPDITSPTISQVSKLTNRLGTWQPCPVSAIVTDNLGIDTSGIFLQYRVTNRCLADSVILIPAGVSGHFAGELPLVFSAGDTVEYRVAARDASISGNIAASLWQKFLVGFEDFETDLNSWSIDPLGWGLNPLGYTGSYSVCSSPQGFYDMGLDVSLTSKYGIDLSQTDKAVLTFGTAYFIEENSDFGYIEISSDSAATWQRLGTVFTGTNGDWEAASVSLSAFTGDGFNDVRIRFRFISDSTQAEGMIGWYIDDVRVIPGIEVGMSNPSEKIALPQSFALYQNYPNPFNPSTTIEFALPKSAFVTLKVYNLLGEEVAALVAEKRSAGIHKFNWDASGLASGVYLYRLQVGDPSAGAGQVFVQVKKLILMR